MTTPMPDRSFVVSFGFNVLAVAAFWVLSFVLVQAGERMMGGWPASEIGQALGCVGGVLLATRLRARAAAYFLMAMVAFSVAELAIHSIFGIGSAQGGPTHLAVMAAGGLGVLFGALAVSRIPAAELGLPRGGADAGGDDAGRQPRQIAEEGTAV